MPIKRSNNELLYNLVYFFITISVTLVVLHNPQALGIFHSPEGWAPPAGPPAPLQPAALPSQDGPASSTERLSMEAALGRYDEHTLNMVQNGTRLLLLCLYIVRVSRWMPDLLWTKHTNNNNKVISTWTWSHSWFRCKGKYSLGV